jgi:RNA polymerase sigma-70 factor (ECF subfamily)
MGRTARSKAIAELVARHYEAVYRYAFRLSGSSADAQDITQETFVKAQQKLEQLRQADSAAGWLLAIARNTFLQKHRMQRRAAELPLESLGELCDEPDQPLIVDEIDADEVQAAVQELPEDFRLPLVLFYFEECSYREIADHLQTPIGTVMSRLARAKAHLRARLGVPRFAAAAIGGRK